jgi:hypothetical protein
MAIIGSMTTGAGVLTSLILPQCPQFLIINNTYSETFDLTNLDVSINGASTISLIGADDIDACAQIKSHSTGDEASSANGLIMALELSNGEINAPTLIRLTNEGSNTNTIYGVSQQVGTAPYRVSQFTVNSVSNQIFQDFNYLLINSSPANIDSIEIQWTNGFKNRFAPQELPVLFRNEYAAEKASKFSASNDVSWINNEDGLISSCVVFTNSSGSATVTVGRI